MQMKNFSVPRFWLRNERNDAFDEGAGGGSVSIINVKNKMALL